jgi:rhamnosyl/mannosyltransferase
VNVHFAGFVSDDVRAALFEHCRAVVFPSYVRSEAFGVTLLEGSLFAKPLISCEIGTGTTFVNIDGETGLVIPPGNSWELAMAMRSLSVDSGLASEMGKASRRRLESVFSGDKVGRAYRDLYQEVVSKVKHP